MEKCYETEENSAAINQAEKGAGDAKEFREEAKPHKDIQSTAMSEGTKAILTCMNSSDPHPPLHMVQTEF